MNLNKEQARARILEMMEQSWHGNTTTREGIPKGYIHVGKVEIFQLLDEIYDKPEAAPSNDFVDHPYYGDVMKASVWEEQVRNGMFTPDDGIGYWATETKMRPDTDCFDGCPEWATHVVWFNK